MPYYKTPHATSISGYCWETNNSQTWWPETTIHLFRTGCSWALLLSYMVSVGITDGLWPLLMSAGDWLVPHGLDHMFRVSLSLIVTSHSQGDQIGLIPKLIESKQVRAEAASVWRRCLEGA